MQQNDLLFASVEHGLEFCFYKCDSLEELMMSFHKWRSYYVVDDVNDKDDDTLITSIFLYTFI